MHLSRIQIKNLRNFRSLDVKLRGDTVLIGENRVGKSNFLFALRLVFDAGLPDTARQLKFADIWDGCDLSTDPECRVDLDFTEFETDAALLALLTDYRIAEDHSIARLSYVFRKKAEVKEQATSEADYEFLVFGGGDEARPISGNVRRRISLNLLSALRDAEGELGTWRTSPLRPLLEDAIRDVPAADLAPVAEEMASATNKLGALAPVKALEASLRKDLAALAGPAQDIKAKLAFAPSDPLRVFRSIGLFIDDGKRGIGDASLGSANLALLAMRLAEFEFRKTKNERNFTFLCIEEPEAHLHPHLQRKIFKELFREDGGAERSLFLTTHSPNIASVAPLKSVVLLRHTSEGTVGHSLAGLPLTAEELEDVQRYITTTRADVLFSRGVVFVEGDAEEALIPVFADSIGKPLDELGIAVCNVAGVNFAPYVKLAMALGMPYAVITDWDPLDGTKPPLGKARAFAIADARRAATGREPISEETRKNVDALADDKFREKVVDAGIFLNSSTLEVEVAGTAALRDALLSILEAEDFGSVRRKRLTDWKAGTSPVNGEQLLAMIADVGKGRLAARLADKAIGLTPPDYIRAAIEHVAKDV